MTPKLSSALSVARNPLPPVNQRIKVACVITRLDWAGPADIVRMICNSLNGDNYNIKLIVGRTKNPSANTRKFLEEYKDNLIVIPSLIRDINPVLDFLAFLKLYQVFVKEKFDIIHTHTAKAGALGRLAGFLAGSHRIIHMAHGHNFYGYFNYWISSLIIYIERFLCLFTSRFIALSQLEKKDLIKCLTVKADKIKVIPSGLDLGFKNIDLNRAQDKKRQLGFKREQKIVGMVSRLEPVKGAEYFVEAIPEILKKAGNLQFLIVGEGSLRAKLETRVKELGLENKVTFTGWREDALEIISFLDILVQPSLNEAIGRVILEAGGVGVAVVATKVGGIPEIVKDGVTGLLVAPENPGELALAICGLLGDENRRREISRNARDWVDEKFSGVKMTREIASLYKEILAI